jgi:dolichyl-phosphate-mannose-protein mannosyltransferase
MSAPPPSLRQRGEKASKQKGQSKSSATSSGDDEVPIAIKKEVKAVVKREWDYKLALFVITVLAFITRFYGISHPNQVVFDEVHFGKVLFSLHVQTPRPVADNTRT